MTKTKQKLSEMICADCGTVGKMKKITYVFSNVIFDNERSSVEGHVVPGGAPTHACRACGAEVGAAVRSKIIIDIQMLRSVTNYAHWIPGLRGLYREFFAEHFPGWDWNDFVPRLIDKKILRFNEADNPEFTMLQQGLFISADVQAIEFIPQKNGVRVKVIAKD
jgi:hypothetical protein